MIGDVASFEFFNADNVTERVVHAQNFLILPVTLISGIPKDNQLLEVCIKHS